jgi:uncharacterized protein (TIGR03663 family)
MQVENERKSFLDTPVSALMKLDWERVLIIAIILAAVLTRVWDLSYRAWNHDEAIHTDWSWNLYTGRGYQHNPIYHGPLLYHATAFVFFLLGDNDFTARLPNTTFGIVLAILPFFFRKWLGRKGALVTAAMLVISPAVMYYSRFNRHDVYVELFVVLMALAIFKYFDERQDRWLYASATFLALAFTAMETTFIFVAIFAIFLCAHFTFEYLRPRVPWGDALTALFAAIFGIPFFGVIAAFSAVRSLTGKTYDDTWRAIPSFDLAMVFGTFSIPLLTPAVIYALNPVWLKLFNAEFLTVNAFSDLNTIIAITQSQPDVTLRVVALTVGMIALSALLGIWWNARVWLIGAMLFWPLFVVFFTTFFTNGGGFFTGLLGSLGYWLSQQSVQRGSQPAYYYLLVTMPMYEVLPYIVGIVGMVWYWFRHNPARLVAILGWILWIIFFYVAVRPIFLEAMPGVIEQLVVAFIALLILLAFFATYDSTKPESTFPTFLFVWAIGAMIIFSWAGEKMPWLTMHLTIPLAFVSGWVLDQLLDVDWRDLFARGALWLALLIPLTLAMFVMMLTMQPFQGQALDQLSATNGFIVAFILLLGFIGPALFLIARRFSPREIARVSAVGGVLVLTALTIRFAWMGVFLQPDNAAETIIYAQGSHDNVTAMREIEDLSRRLCAQTASGRAQTVPCDNGNIKVAYDDDSSWPFVWYLRNYRNAQYYGGNPNAPFDAPVVIVGSKNEEAVKPWLGNKYLKRQYKLIWWPLEGYKDLSSERVLNYFRDPQQRLDLFNAWFHHQYKENQSSWPYVHLFSFYVRKDVAAMLWNYGGTAPQQPAPESEYEKKFVRLDAARMLGMPGKGNGQFEYPRAIAIDAQGNVYIADSDNHRIQKFDATGKFLLMWGSKSSEGVPNPPPSTFNQPWGIAVDKAGNVYVSDTWNHRIQKFDATGKFLTMWGTNGDTRGVAQGSPMLLYGPRAIAVDAQNNLYVSDTGNKRVTKFSAVGEPLGQYGGVGADAGQFLEQVGLAIDHRGNIFVADTWNQRIQKFDANFNFVMQWSVEAWDSQTVVNKPYLAVDSDGNVFATDPDGARVLKFSNDGKLLAVFGVRGSDLASFNLPTGMAFDAQGNLYVADSGNQRVLVFVKP